MDDVDAELLRMLRAVDDDLFAVEGDGAGILRVDAGQDLHEARLSRPVLAHQGENLTPVELETHILERLHARERLTDPGDLQ